MNVVPRTPVASAGSSRLRRKFYLRRHRLIAGPNRRPELPMPKILKHMSESKAFFPRHRTVLLSVSPPVAMRSSRYFLLLTQLFTCLALVTKSNSLPVKRGIPSAGPAQDLARKASEQVRQALDQAYTLSQDFVKQSGLHENPLARELQQFYDDIARHPKMEVPFENHRSVRDPLRKSFSA